MATSSPPALVRAAARTVDRIEAALRAAERRRRRLLWASLLLSALLDSALTGYGLQRGLTEANPVVRALVAALGVPAALAVTKGVALAAGLVAWRALPAGRRAVVPLGLSVPWWSAVVVNVVALSSL